MSDLVVLDFYGTGTADEVLTKLRSLQKENLIEIGFLSARRTRRGGLPRRLHLALHRFNDGSAAFDPVAAIEVMDFTEEDVIVRLRPMWPSAYSPEIDNVAHEVVSVGLAHAQEIEQSSRLRLACAQMYVRDEDRTVVLRAMAAHVETWNRILHGAELEDSRCGSMTHVSEARSSRARWRKNRHNSCGRRCRGRFASVQR
jgi:hypothetical protein